MSIEAEIRSIKTTLNRLVQQSKPKETWVNAGWITDLTGWNGEKMRQAREQNIIQYRSKSTGSYEYLLQSLDEKFIIKKQAV